MRFRAISLRYFRLLGLLWPAVLLAAALAWPGERLAPSMLSLQPAGAANPAPPADSRGSVRYVSGAGVTAEAKIFWESADKAKVKFIIELEPEKK